MLMTTLFFFFLLSIPGVIPFVIFKHVYILIYNRNLLLLKKANHCCLFLLFLVINWLFVVMVLQNPS